MNIAVTGASGWVGRQICHELGASGHAVCRIARKATASGEWGWDLIDDTPSALRERLRGCGLVIHAAAHVHRPNETEAEKVLFERVNVKGTEKVVKACQDAGVPRLLLVSTLAVYDWKEGRAMGEEDRLAPATAYARSKLKAEELVRNSCLDWRIARLATVYGTGDHANFARLAGALHSGCFLIPGNGEWRKSVLPVDRAGELVARFGLEPDPVHRIMNMASPEAPSLAGICTAFSGVGDFPEARHLSLPVFRALAGVGDFFRALHVPAPLHSDVLQRLTTSTVVEVRRQQEMFPDLMWPPFREDLARFRKHYVR